MDINNTDTPVESEDPACILDIVEDKIGGATDNNLEVSCCIITWGFFIYLTDNESACFACH